MQRVRTPRAMKETVKTKPSKEYGVLQHSAILIIDYRKKTDSYKWLYTLLADMCNA